jgi:hypothetical protein
MLKPLLARGEIDCIGATTLNEYREYIEKDRALGAPLSDRADRLSRRSKIPSRFLRGLKGTL